jgi:hypothetical protein
MIGRRATTGCFRGVKGASASPSFYIEGHQSSLELLSGALGWGCAPYHSFRWMRVRMALSWDSILSVRELRP